MCHKCGENLSCGEEDVVRYVAHSAGYDSQSNSGEDIGVVALSWVEGASIRQCHFVEWTSAGKDAPALETQRRTQLASS